MILVQNSWETNGDGKPLGNLSHEWWAEIMRMSGWRGISLVLTGIQIVVMIGGGSSGYRKKRVNPG